MKPLDKLNNVEKAKLLHELVPDEIPAALEFILQMCKRLLDEAEQHRAAWDNGLITFDFWLSLSQEVEKRIIEQDTHLHTRSRAFSDELFDGYLALWTVFCLQEFAKQGTGCKAAFRFAVAFFF